jgi:hypothetical protein
MNEARSEGLDKREEEEKRGGKKNKNASLGW